MAKYDKTETRHHTTNAPGGIEIKRDGAVFTVTWKITSENYGAGQWLEFALKIGSGWTSWNDGYSISTGQTKKTIKINPSLYHPDAPGILAGIRVRLCGRRKDYITEYNYTETYKEWNKTKKEWEKKTKDCTCGVTHKMSTSDWTEKTYLIKFPNKVNAKTPVLDSENVNKCSFPYKLTAKATAHRWFRDVEWQSYRIKNSTATNGKKAWGNKHKADYKSGTISSADSSVPITEDSAVINVGDNSYTRWVRFRSRGLRGNTDWVYARHVYARPFQANVKSARATQKADGTTEVTVKWSSAQSGKDKGNHPIDKTTVEYVITEPEAGLSCPDGLTWTTAGSIKDTKEEDALAFTVDGTVGENKVIFVRVNNEHDKHDEIGVNYGSPTIVRGIVRKLSAPTIDSVEWNASNHSATLKVTNTSTVADSRIAVYVREKYGSAEQLLVFTIPCPQQQETIQVSYPEDMETPEFLVQAIVADVTRSVINETFMQSVRVYENGAVPVAPTNVSCSSNIIDGVGTITVTWDWSWARADGVILSWSDHRDAWESTDEPSEYEVTVLHKGQWNISGLETGKIWYVRVRFYRGEDDRVLSPWSELTDESIVALKKAPAIPNIVLSKNTVAENDTVEASWAYVSGDGTLQAQADLALAEWDAEEGEWIKQDPPFLKVGGEQHVTLDIGELRWSNDNVYNICVRVVSASGEPSKWSKPTTLAVAPLPTVNVTNTSLVSQTIIDDSEYTVSETFDDFVLDYATLVKVTDVEATSVDVTPVEGGYHVVYGVYDETVTDLSTVGMSGVPDDYVGTFTVTIDAVESHNAQVLDRLALRVTAVGADVDGVTRVNITRKEDYNLERPDESDYNGFAGELIASVGHTGESEITIEKNQLVGTLDDGETYVMNVTVIDTYGQSVTSDDIEFEVHWEHQALMPEASFNMQNGVAFITPIAPSGWESGDVCDIYRLSADKPELIVEGAEFGKTYVDPYPAIGAHGGHKLVYRTRYDDFIMDDNKLAVLTLGLEEGDRLELDHALIDFDGRQIPLYYNVDVGNQWQKDFKETRYLGGSVQGDWNPAIGRTVSVGTVKINLTDEDDVIALKRLAVYAGQCHLRTQDGSSIACDIQVSEDRPHDKRNLVSTFSLSVTRVDSNGHDGMILKQWEAQNGVG